MKRTFNNRILIVEDTEDTAFLLKFYLENQGYEVTSAENGLSALEELKKAKNHPPAVILLDLMMPVMDGEKFVEVQQKDPSLSQIPVILMSATSNLESEARRLHVTGYLKKPTDVQGLLQTAERFCSK